MKLATGETMNRTMAGRQRMCTTPTGLLTRVFVHFTRVLTRLLAMLVRSRRVLFCFSVLALTMLVCCLKVVMRSSSMV